MFLSKQSAFCQPFRRLVCSSCELPLAKDWTWGESHYMTFVTVYRTEKEEAFPSTMPFPGMMLFQPASIKGRRLPGKPVTHVMRLLISSINAASTHQHSNLMTWRYWSNSWFWWLTCQVPLAVLMMLCCTCLWEDRDRVSHSFYLRSSTAACTWPTRRVAYGIRQQYANPICRVLVSVDGPRTVTCVRSFGPSGHRLQLDVSSRPNVNAN